MSSFTIVLSAYMNAVEHFYSTRRFMPKNLDPSIAALLPEEPS